MLTAHIPMLNLEIPHLPAVRILTVLMRSVSHSLFIDPSVDEHVIYMASRVLHPTPSHLGAPAPTTYRCFFYGERCSTFHVIPVPISAGLKPPYTPDDLKMDMWIQRDQANESGVFTSHGLRRFTFDYSSVDGVLESFTFFWARTLSFQDGNNPIQNILLEDHTRIFPWHGVAVMVKHRGSLLMDMDESDEFSAKVVLNKCVLPFDHLCLHQC